MILLLDNHDSFVHNLARYFRRLGQETKVIRSDATDVQACAELRPLAIVISPGPRRPEEAGCSVDVIRKLGTRIPLLGVCLGHQAIGYAFGGNVVRCEGMHGRASEITHQASGVFEGCRSPMRVGRYHSLAIEAESLPRDLLVTAKTHSIDGPEVVMGVEHREFPIHGVQFHPESVLSEDGADVLANFVRIAIRWNEAQPVQRVAS
jgi:anthranilate synthase/aminodeoxychorismate synthase-like glutamine amidotransferase